MNPQILSHFRSARLSLHECNIVQQAMDVEIKNIPPESLAESVRMLRAQRNAYALINAWLPPELMIAIFYEIVLSSQCVCRKEGFETHGFSREYIVISHVCQVWRTIAIGAPHLWADISLASADVTAAMLHRSKASQISIVYRSINVEEPISTVPLALAHADRAFEIVLTLRPAHIQYLVSKYLTKPMPFLKQLILYRYGGFPRPATPECFLPPGCLEGANVLSHLYLTDVGILPGSILPATLTVLSLMYPPERLTVSQMIDLLEPLENLCDLCIQDTLCSNASYTTKPSILRRLSLRTHLIRLHLDGLARERGDFMSRFPVMPKTQLSLSCDAETLDDLHFGQMLKPMYGVQGLLRGLSLSFLSRGCIEGYSSASLPVMRSQMCFSVSVGLHSIFPWHETFRDLCASMSLDSVEMLFVGSAHDLGESIIAPLLGTHLRGVRTLRLMNEAVKYVLRHMHPQAEGISPAFPHLKALTVCYERCDSSEIYSRLLGPVADCLISRKRSGMTAVVEELEINGEVVPSKYLENLEGLKSWTHPSGVHGTV